MAAVSIAVPYHVAAPNWQRLGQIRGLFLYGHPASVSVRRPKHCLSGAATGALVIVFPCFTTLVLDDRVALVCSADDADSLSILLRGSVRCLISSGIGNVEFQICLRNGSK